jgi:hypothetical protein
MSRDLDVAIDALYQVPLDRFTADRNALAASLKKAGDKAAAEHVKALTKPSATAWAVNQVWWRHRDRFQAMLDAGAAQRTAHVAWARGQVADVREAAEARRVAVSSVTEAAIEALGGRTLVAHDVHYRISGTVEALASSGMPEGETPGRLTRDLQSSGLVALSALAGLPDPPPRPTVVARAAPRAEPAAPAARASQVAQAEARVSALTAALEVATRAWEDTAAAEAQARAVLDAAARRRAELEAALDESRAAEAAARRALSAASTAASKAELDRARAARDASRAREARDALLR